MYALGRSIYAQGMKLPDSGSSKKMDCRRRAVLIVSITMV